MKSGVLSCRNDAYLKHFTNGIEEPSVGVDLLLVLCLQDEYDLDRHEVVRIVANRQDQLRSGVNGKLRGILGDSP